MTETIYFDSASDMRHRPAAVRRKMAEALQVDGRSILAETRERAAAFFGCSDPNRVVLTASGTEALNFAIRGTLSHGDCAVTTVLEHDSVLRPLLLFTRDTEYLSETYHFRTRRGWKPVSGIAAAGLSATGTLDYEELRTVAVRKRPRLLIVSHGCCLTGELVDLKRVSAIAREAGAFLLVDASQTAGLYPLSMEELGIDLLCISGHKHLMGPQGTGLLLVGSRVELRPLLAGSTFSELAGLTLPAQLPESLESGVPNIPGMAGLNAGLMWCALTGIGHVRAHVHELTRLFSDGLKELPGIRILGDVSEYDRAPIVALNVEGRSAHSVAMELRKKYAMTVPGGTHAAPLMEEALGIRKQGALRFSFSAFTTAEEIRRALDALEELAGE